MSYCMGPLPALGWYSLNVSTSGSISRAGGLAAVGGLSAPSHGQVYCSLPLPPRNRELKEALLGHSEALDTSDN